MSSIPVPAFDQVHVVSDLHIGGEPGFQIFRTSEQLTGLVRKLQKEPPAQAVALVINGDMVDFLAEPTARCFDPYGATGKLQRISTDENFKAVFAALQSFVSTDNHYLVINLGNHDLELALPWVRAHLVELLTGKDRAAQGRLTVVTDGTGFSCSIGDKRMLCLHGNEVDTWNVADYEMIRCIGRDITQGRAVPDWTPNAGTRLVIDVMNTIKRRFPFVDLLKPEAQAVVPVLMALDETQLPKLQQIVGVASRLSWDKVRRVTGFLSKGEELAPTSLDLEQGLAQRRRDALPARADPLRAAGPVAIGASVVVATAEEYFRQGFDPVLLVEQSATDQLSAMSAVWSWARGKSKLEVLYEAVRDLEKDRSFEVHDRDDTFRRMDKYVGPEIDFVVTGHTHMEKEIPRRTNRGGTYFNTGSWVPRIRFTPEILASLATFKPVFEALKEGRTIADLEGQRDLVLTRPVVLSVSHNSNGVFASLQKVSLTNGGIKLEPVTKD